MMGKRIIARKEPVQQRSKLLRQSLLEAATCILESEGPLNFTTNRVAERAGVNIASLYQYYPNKESLLFHLIELQWTKTYQAVYPFLKDERLSHRERLHHFIHKFFQMEEKDRTLKDAITHLGFLIEDTKEYRDLVAIGRTDIADFLGSQRRRISHEEQKMDAEFILHTITSFSECKSAGRWRNLERDSRNMAEMICLHFKIDS